MIPEKEREHYDAAIAAMPDEIDPPLTPEEEQAAAERKADAIAIRNGCRAILAADPEVWGILTDHTTPRAGEEMLMPPRVDMDFGQFAAYRMGQQSVVDWIRTTANARIEE